LSFWTTVQPLDTTFTKRFGCSIPGTTMRPNPTPTAPIQVAKVVRQPQSPVAKPVESSAMAGLSAGRVAVTAPHHCRHH
jgi:hypothetical protein